MAERNDPAQDTRWSTPRIDTVRVTRPAAPGAHRRAVFDSDDIFAGADEVHIVHGDALYRLRRTSLGKLILTK